MEFKIEYGPVFTTLRVLLKQGEQFKAEAGAMVSMSPTIELEAKATSKGLFGALKATVGGESLFASIYTAKTGDGELVLAPSVTGEIIKIDLDGNTILAEGGAYLAGSPNLEISSQGSFRSLVSGEGLFLQKVTGSGVLFLNSYGAIFEKNLQAGEKYIVDTGHLVAFENTVTYTLKKVSKGFFSTIASGEGLVAEYSGPGKVWIQTRNISSFVNIISRLLPKK